jgi:zinc protease
MRTSILHHADAAGSPTARPLSVAATGKRRLVAGALGAALALATARPANALELAYHKTVLPNGLTVVVHEDHSLPLVAVNLLYDVGARDEEAKRTGFAHLFEHLMFMGTERAPTKMFDAWMEAAGGSNNAWTSSDFTDYFEVGPPGLLPLFFWLEADRMQMLGKQIDEAKLDLQRDVVLNERRQSIENVPYGKVELVLPELMYPENHPYHHPVIGSPEDLRAATVLDVKNFFFSHYVPSNASLVVAGDVTTSDAETLATRYFGALPSGPKPPRVRSMPIPKLGRVVRQTIEDQVELPKIVMAWHSPAHLQPGDAELDLLANVLSHGKASRLYQALVYDKPIAQTVAASQSSDVLSSEFTVEVLVRPGVSLDDAEKATDAVLAEMRAKAPTDKELARAKNDFEFGFVDRLQSVGALARLMNLYQAETGDPDYVEKDLARYRAATADGVKKWADEVLDPNDRVVLRIVPIGTGGAGAQSKRDGGAR